MKCEVWKPCSHQHWPDKLQLLNQRFFEHATEKNHLLCYWWIIHNSISNICPNFKCWVLTLITADELLDGHWAKIVPRKKFQSISNAITCIYLIKGLLSRILVFLVWPLYSTLAIREWQSCKQKICSRLWSMTSHEQFLSNRFIQSITNLCFSG